MNPEVECEEELRNAFQRLQQEEDRRQGDYTSSGSRYSFIRFEGAGLTLPATDRDVLAKLHVTLVHPSNDCLARMLLIHGAKKEILDAVKNMHCEICQRVMDRLRRPKVHIRTRAGSTSALGSIASIFWTPSR